MKKNGAEVLDDFVGARNKEEFFKMFVEKTGYNITESPGSRVFVRQTDIKYVDEATHLIAVVDHPSYGVGMEIQRAIDKPKMGLPATPIWCLIREDLLAGLTPMIRGISKKEAPGFELKTYENLNEAERLIGVFLSSR